VKIKGPGAGLARVPERSAASRFSEGLIPTDLRGSSELVEEGAYVVDEVVWCFHGGEVATAVEV
jgi:hypothetical protein